MSTPCDVGEPVQPTGRWRVLAPFEFREFRLLIAAMSLFLFAEGMWTVVMALQVIALADDPAALSLVAACLAGGLLAFILVGGIVADRVPSAPSSSPSKPPTSPRPAPWPSSACSAACRLWHMAVAATVLGIGAAFFFPAYSAYLPRILPAEQLLAANGVEGAIRPTLQQAIGPAAAGALIGLTFPALGSVAVSGLMAVGLILLVAMRPSHGEHIVLTVEREQPHVLHRFA